MPSYVRVLLDRSADKPLDYSLPEGLRDSVRIGSRVRVPVRGRSCLATVVALLEESKVPGIKPVEAMMEGAPTVLPVLLEMAKWMSGYYCCSEEAAVRTVLPQAVRDGTVGRRRLSAAELTRAVSEEEIEALEKRAPRQVEIVRQLATETGPVLLSALRGEGAADAAVRGLVKRGWVRVVQVDVGRDPHAGETYLPAVPPTLNAEQEVVVAKLFEWIDAGAVETRPALLHGVTGSGKTEVYLRAIDRALRLGRTALVLVPEISLTPQTVERFKMRFAGTPHQVAVLHSHLSAGERYDEWFRIHEGEASIVIGARSAVFAPLRNVGLIVVDEEHEGSYKQDETPRYHARDLAVLRGKLEKCPVLLGTATPSLETFHNVQTGKYGLLELTLRADDRSMPVIRVLDMRVQRRKSGPDSILSAPLSRAIEERLAKQEQSILFLNRRGYSTSLICSACGHVCQCPHCSVSLTFHRESSRLVCHICGHLALAPHDCPECATPGIRHTGFGTEKLEEAVVKLFPKARLARMDADTMTRKNAYRETLGKFRTGQIDILVGTQMIAKGLHFPNVTLVGIINADLGLHMPDFRAGERTFQLLTQVAGRAGRGEMEGEVLVQSFTPHSPAIQFARHHDFPGFWEQESEFRRHFRYPPYTRMVLLHVRGEKEELTKFTASTLVRRLAEGLPENTVLGEAAPAPLEKARNQYRFHIVLRGPKGMTLSRHVAAVLSAFQHPEEIHISVDVDPLHLL